MRIKVTDSVAEMETYVNHTAIDIIRKNTVTGLTDLHVGVFVLNVIEEPEQILEMIADQVNNDPQ